MDDLLEFRLRVVELAYKYNKEIGQVLTDVGRIQINKKEEEKKKK